MIPVFGQRSERERERGDRTHKVEIYEWTFSRSLFYLWANQFGTFNYKQTYPLSRSSFAPFLLMGELFCLQPLFINGQTYSPPLFVEPQKIWSKFRTKLKMGQSWLKISQKKFFRSKCSMIFLVFGLCSVWNFFSGPTSKILVFWCFGPYSFGSRTAPL